MAILSFGDEGTRQFFLSGIPPRKAGWAIVRAVAMRKLDMIRYAADLKDLRSPPANRLESLKGDLKGSYSIRINDRWRVVFQWTRDGAAVVRIADYH